MGDELTRRNFIKATGTVAGVTVATGFSPFAYAKNEKIRIAMIGTGSQGRFHIEHGIAGTPELEIVAIADVLRFGQFQGWQSAGGKEEVKEHLYYDYKVMLDKEKNIDAVVLATPYKTHYSIVMDCLDAGKFVFCERTMAHENDLCRNIVKKCHETDKFVQVGHQRRYNPEYLYAMKEALNGSLGRITYIEGQWHRNDSWRRPLPKLSNGQSITLDEQEAKLVPNLEHFVNWRIYEELSGGLVSELASHHIETVNWMLGRDPSRVSASGGINYWRDGRTTDDNATLVFDYDMTPKDHGFRAIEPNDKLPDRSRINEPYSVRFLWSGLLTNWSFGEYLCVKGDKGAYEFHDRTHPEQKGGDYYQEEPVPFNRKTGERITDPKEIQAIIGMKGTESAYWKYKIPDPVALDSLIEPNAYVVPPDAHQFRDFAHHIKNGGKPRTNEMCGLMASVSVTAALEALKKKVTVEIDPAVWKFDFETPDPFSTDTTLI